MVSAILKHEDTPAVLYDAIAETINDMDNELKIDIDSPEAIEQTLLIYNQQKGKLSKPRRK